MFHFCYFPTHIGCFNVKLNLFCSDFAQFTHHCVCSLGFGDDVTTNSSGNCDKLLQKVDGGRITEMTKYNNSKICSYFVQNRVLSSKLFNN